MKTNRFTAFCITTFLMSGFPTLQLVQARPPFQIAQSIWKSFSSNEGGFKVLMPGTPTEQKNNLKTSVGAITVYKFSVLRENEALYGVAYSDLPGNSSLNSRDTNQLLTQVAAGFAEGSKGKLISQRTIRLGNFTGREIRLQLAGGAIARGRIYLANKRLYQVVVATAKEKSLTKSIEGFFNSFQILNKPTAPQKPINGSTATPKPTNDSTATPKPTNDSTATPKPATEDLNAELKQAVCAQNWTQAVKIVNRMIAIAPSPESRTELEQYRSQLQGLANSGSRVPSESLPGCTPGK